MYNWEFCVVDWGVGDLFFYCVFLEVVCVLVFVWEGSFFGFVGVVVVFDRCELGFEVYGVGLGICVVCWGWFSFRFFLVKVVSFFVFCCIFRCYFFSSFLVVFVFCFFVVLGFWEFECSLGGCVECSGGC